MLIAYVHARHGPPDDSGGREPMSSPAGDRNDPLGIILGVWLWAILLVMIAGLFVSWL